MHFLAISSFKNMCKIKGKICDKILFGEVLAKYGSFGKTCAKLRISFKFTYCGKFRYRNLVKDMCSKNIIIKTEIQKHVQY